MQLHAVRGTPTTALTGGREAPPMSQKSTKPLVKRMPKRLYEDELERLQVQLVGMQQ